MPRPGRVRERNERVDHVERVNRRDRPPVRGQARRTEVQQALRRDERQNRNGRPVNREERHRNRIPHDGQGNFQIQDGNQPQQNGDAGAPFPPPVAPIMTSTEVQTDQTLGGGHVEQQQAFLPDHGESPLSAFNLETQRGNPGQSTPVGQNPSREALFLYSLQSSANNPLLSTINDCVSAQIPLNIKEKTWAGKYINLALLQKSSPEILASQGAQLILSEDGFIETRPKTLSEKVKTIEQWTDAFVIFMDIYLVQNPQACSELLTYMATIRQAASRRHDFAWRVYDEQFRMRQENFLQPWSRLNSDLWLKVMTMPIHQSNNSFSSSAGDSPYLQTCSKYNEGQCPFAQRCRYRHVCSACGGGHPSVSCYSFRTKQLRNSNFPSKPSKR
ncbi:uncharacterized protein LOC128546687 [Mercenaria mercenaria]|uniref:uncharacterized protein LOC128546687 n=1 Tax=Mercenaria mercenaria TaxID=6596 RepID=UPI00234E39C9|nr:uncharacterized protein LOC128546687 [Mercenaria mercenaria]